MRKRISDDYLKVVEWSEEDKCYVGTAPGLFLGGVHGNSQEKVFHELCEVVEENIKILKKHGKRLPPPTSGKSFSGRIALRIPPELHKAIAVRALQSGKSVNKLIRQRLEGVV